MSPEEFDNRLRASFKDEYLPPKEQLWQNINTRLDQKPAGSVWHWLAPVIIVAVVGLAWIGNALMFKKNPEIAVVENTSTANADSAGNIAPALTENGNNNSNSSTVYENANPSSKSLEEAQNSNAKSSDDKLASKSPVNADNKVEKSNSSNSNSQSNGLDQSNSSESENETSPSSRFSHSNNKFGKNTNSDGTSNRRPKRNAIATSEGGLINSITGNDDYTTETRMRNFEKFKHSLNIDNAETFSFFPSKKKKTFAERKRDAILNSGDFSNNKWWLNIGIGQQVSYNTAEIGKDSIDYIHKDLYKDIKKMTGNSGGFNVFGTVQRKFGNNNRFSVELGLQYSMRKEMIGLNESTLDIKIADQNNKIKYYINSFGFFVDGQDTIPFLLTESFAYVRKNTYNVITLPFRFNVEQGITSNTFVSLGLGGGLSYINSQSTGHYNMVQQKELKVNSNYFTGSLNTMLSLYTNYNAAVQLGMYTGYQMYLTPFSVKGQYQIKMRDLQIGFTCKVPLDKL